MPAAPTLVPTFLGLITYLVIPLLGAVAVAAFGWVAWQATGLGRPAKTVWRVEHRVQGRLVMARVRKRAA